MSDDDPDLDGAYNLTSPDAARKLYANWATSYDESFAETRAYLAPARIAEVYAGHADMDDAPILDIGAGTGLVAEALQSHGSWPIDGLDISPEMLAEARLKGLYGEVFESDLNAPETLPRRRYGAILSAGTFTHGHVGPEALPRLLDLARPGALFVLGINSEHYESKGFAQAFEEMQDWITDVAFVEVGIYGAPIGDEHDDDTILIAVYRRKGRAEE